MTDLVASPATVPELQPGDVAFAFLQAGTGHVCGLTSAGVAYCWGSNSYGQLGDRSTTNRETPTAVVAP
jgi:alpha-tubulin suppressor-like RCC1 family protein